MGALLAPLVVSVQFYVIRLLGISFDLTTDILIIINIPALILMWKRGGEVQLPDFRGVIHWGLVLVVPLACLAGPLVFWPQWRLFSGHPWMHADIVYSFANGELIPEEPSMAGVVLSYPWVGHIYQAVLSYVLDSPPVSNYRWTNLLWLVFTIQLTAGLVTRLGGRRFAAITSVIFLLFGVNFLGYLLAQNLPREFVKLINIWGDYRYTPWILKFCHFNQMSLALGLFIGITFLTAERWPEAHSWKRSILVFFLLSSLGFIYPLLLPAAYGVVFAGGVSMLLERFGKHRIVPRSHFVGIGLGALLAAVITIIYLDLVTQDSVKATMLGMDSLRSVLKKSVETFVVTFPLLCSLAVVFLKCWKNRRHTTLVLVLGGLSSLVCYVVLDIPYWSNEYKFIFTAAICLAPFSGLALEPLQDRLGRWALPLTVIIALVLAGPFFHKIHDFSHPEWLPVIDTSRFDLRLDKRERFSGISEAIKKKTPIETVLVLDQANLHLPTLTDRKLFAPPDKNQVLHGFAIGYDTLLPDLRGYDKGLIIKRKTILEGLFNQQSVQHRETSLEQILELGRPVGIILDERRSSVALDWLKKSNIGNRVYSGEDLVLWLVVPGEKYAYK
jgi:hypothetical protein